MIHQVTAAISGGICILGAPSHRTNPGLALLECNVGQNSVYIESLSMAQSLTVNAILYSSLDVQNITWELMIMNNIQIQNQ